LTQKVLWAGRFREGTADTTLAFTSSLSMDQRLARLDVLGSIAHAKMLAGQKIIPQQDGDKIVAGLKGILASIEDGTLTVDPKLEDIHSNIEFLLTDKVKEAGARLHTARSRNDQVVTDVRMFCREATLDTLEAIMALENALVKLASVHRADIIPGFTHVQHAQPITLGHHLLAHLFRLKRDAERLIDSYKRLNVCPLGSAALAGTTYDIDRDQTARALGFRYPCSNSVDGVSDRDFAAEYVFDVSLCMVHLSSICEEMIYWSSPEFRFVEIADAYSTGSSIMPQKKNPDVAELSRGRTAGSIGDLVTLLTLMKGLPLSYNRDLQEDKTVLFASYDRVVPCLHILSLMLSTSTFSKARMAAAAEEGFLNATDLADYLVVKGVPFRKAHEIVGAVVRFSIDHGKKLEELSLDELRTFSELVQADVFEVLPIEKCVQRRRSVGGTSPDVMPVQLDEVNQAIDAQSTFVQEERSRLKKTFDDLLA
jgi:argininosuccinate lyase